MFQRPVSAGAERQVALSALLRCAAPTKQRRLWPTPRGISRFPCHVTLSVRARERVVSSACADWQSVGAHELHARLLFNGFSRLDTHAMTDCWQCPLAGGTCRPLERLRDPPHALPCLLLGDLAQARSWPSSSPARLSWPRPSCPRRCSSPSTPWPPAPSPAATCSAAHPTSQ